MQGNNIHIYRLRQIQGWFPLSLSGMLLLFGLYLALFHFGAEKEDHILAVVGLGGFILAGCSFLLSMGTALILYWKLKKIPFLEGALLVEHQLRQSPFDLPVPWWIPLVRIRWRAAERHEVRQRGGGDLKIYTEGGQERILPLRRGEWTQIDRHFEVLGLMGVFRISFVVQQDCELQVLPSMGKFREPLMIHALLSGSDFSHPLGEPIGDRVDQRNYVQGDPIRQILWKIYARTGELIVRTPERALQPAPKLLAYLIVSEGDGAAAGILWAALEHRLLGSEWRLGADGNPQGVSELEAAQNLIISSAESSAREGCDLARFVRLMREQYGAMQDILIFAPPKRGRWVKEIEQLRLAASATVVLCIDGLAPEVGWKNWVFRPSEQLYYSRADSGFSQLCGELQKLGVTVLVADRQNGVLVDSEHLSRMAS